MYLDDNIKNIIVDFLIDKINPIFIYLFGSFAKGEGREDSDIDIAIYTEEKIDSYELFCVSGDLAFEVKKDIQIVNLKDVSTVFVAQIVGTREVLFCNNEKLMDEFNIRIFKEYAKLNEERKNILDRIREDDRIDVLYNKISIIERCLMRIREVYDDNPKNLNDYTKQDSIILNIQRAVEACIDISMYIVSERKLGIPQNSRDAFEILNENKIIDNKLLTKLKKMIGFRNLAVHNYQKLNLDILQKVIENHLIDFEDFIYHINKLI